MDKIEKFSSLDSCDKETPFEKGGHPDDETFEQYLINQSGGNDQTSQALEEHLLSCPDCVHRIEQLDLVIKGIRAGFDKQRSKKASNSS